MGFETDTTRISFGCPVNHMSKRNNTLLTLGWRSQRRPACTMSIASPGGVSRAYMLHGKRKEKKANVVALVALQEAKKPTLTPLLFFLEAN
jgi:hypothetical protein